MDKFKHLWNRTFCFFGWHDWRRITRSETLEVWRSIFPDGMEDLYVCVDCGKEDFLS